MIMTNNVYQIKAFDNAPARYLMSSCKTSSARNGLHIAESLAKKVRQATPLKHHSMLLQLFGCFPQPDDETLLLRKTKFV